MDQAATATRTAHTSPSPAPSPRPPLPPATPPATPPAAPPAWPMATPASLGKAISTPLPLPPTTTPPIARQRPLRHRLSDENPQDRLRVEHYTRSPPRHRVAAPPALPHSVPAPPAAHSQHAPPPRLWPEPAPPSPPLSARREQRRARADRARHRSRSPEPQLQPLREWMTPALVAAGYVVLHVVNEGSFGTVLKGRSGPDGLWVAIKVVRKHRLTEKEMAAMRKQAITLRALRHRYIAQFYDDFEDEDYFYHVFEFLHGGDLYDRLESRGKPFSEAQVLFLARQLFYSISYLHSRRAAHRDIKLENFVFETAPSDPRQVMKLIDFDLLVVRSRHAPRTETCTDMCGTILYVSPEIASVREHVPEQSDMWACGVMLYVLLSYHMPFQGSSGRQILRAVRSTEPHFGPAVWSNISAETRQLVKDLLNKDGSMRPTADEALERVKQIQALSRESQHTSGRLRSITKGFRSISLNIWDPSGNVVRRERAEARKEARHNSRRSRSTIRSALMDDASSPPNSVRSAYLLQSASAATEHDESDQSLSMATYEQDHIFSNSALALSTAPRKEDETFDPSEFHTSPALGGVLARKRAVQHQNRSKSDLPERDSTAPLRSSRRLRRQIGIGTRIRNWMNLGGGGDQQQR